MDIKDLYRPGEYQKEIKQKMPKSKLWQGLAKAYLVGGLICMFGECIRDLSARAGLDDFAVAAISSLILIGLGSFLTAIGVYDILGQFAGAGSIVPITGFANSIVASAMEYKHEGYVLGVGAKLFTVAGPVLVYGFFASVCAGIFYYFQVG